MLNQIQGLHHVTSLASSASANNDFFTRVLGLRRVKKTVNFDNPDVYHLYYGDEHGTPGTVMTYFPFPKAAPGKAGTGEAGTTAFSVPVGSLDTWANHLEKLNVTGITRDTRFGQNRLVFQGPDGDALALVETTTDSRAPWTAHGLGEDIAIRGFHSVQMRLSEFEMSAELLGFMGYDKFDQQGNVTRFILPDGNDANIIDIETHSGADQATQGAGSVHHIAFAVENRARQLEVREALIDTGYAVTPIIDRTYFRAIYFRTPGGVLFEIATNEPGFDVDEDTRHLGEDLKLPAQHAHLREKLIRSLEPLAS